MEKKKSASSSKKSPSEIRTEILSSLSKGPLSVEQIRKTIKDSNWSTINKYLEELREEEKVAEIISTGQIKIYKKVTGDTYFDIPITDEQRKKFRALFSLIFQTYRELGKQPQRTEVAKCAVHIINNQNTELSDLPVVWYLYGRIPLMAVCTTEDYTSEIKLEKEEIIKSLITEFFNENKGKKSRDISVDQHKKYNEEIYVIYDKISELLNGNQLNNEELISLLQEFFIKCPVDSEFIEVFDLTEKVISLIRKMDKINVPFGEVRNKLFPVLDSLWKFVAIYKLYKSLLEFPDLIDKETLKAYYLGAALEEKKRTLREAISELHSIYLQKLSEDKSEQEEISEDVKEIRKIMEDWTGED